MIIVTAILDLTLAPVRFVWGVVRAIFTTE